LGEEIIIVGAVLSAFVEGLSGEIEL